MATLLLTVSTVAAQNGTDEYRALVRKMEQAAIHRDSLATAMAELREKYVSNTSDRDAIGSRIVALEQESYAAKAQYDRIVAAVAEYEQKNGTAIVVQPDDKSTADTPSETVSADSSVADLVANEFFVRNLPAEDYKALQTAQSTERSVASNVAKYIGLYKNMASVQAAYMQTDAEQVADSLMTCFAQLRTEADGAERAITAEWPQIYDNKLYCYNLLMEKSGHDNMLAYSEQIAANAAENIGKDAGGCSSEALMQYYHQKRCLVDYETKIAASLDLGKAKDSLAAVGAALRQADFLQPAINLQKRYFIEYEPLKVVRPSLYNAKNPIPRTKVYEHGTIYRIRIGIFRMTPNMSAWRGITPLSYSDAYNNGLKAYFVGGFRTEQEADDGVKYLKRIGFRDPVVVMWVDGEYVSDPAKWAAEHIDKYNIEISGTAVIPETVKSAILARKSDAAFSKAGAIFIVGKFAGKAEAEDVAATILATKAAVNVKVVKCE
ncbi:MAG: hypothetical protein ACI35T_02550 [Alistipes sp.]